MPAKHVLCAVLAAAGALALAVPAEARDRNETEEAAVDVAHRRNDRAPQAGGIPDRAEARGDHYQLISTSSSASKDKVAAADLPADVKQYDYPLVRPVYAPFVTRPSMPAYSVPFVEILDHHRDPPSFDVIDNHHSDPPFVTTQRPSGAGHYVGSPMVSTVVVQDLSQTPQRPSPTRPSPPTAKPGIIAAVHHLNPTKIPFTDVQVVTKPLGSKPSRPGGGARPPNFTDKLEETSLESGGSSGGAESGEDSPLLENPPNLDMSGIVEEVVKKVFRENQVLHDAGELLPTSHKAWPCPPVTCCSASKCSTFVKCVSGAGGAGRQCPTRAERVPQALALSKPSNGSTNTTDPEADVRDGEPRFKKKKILKKKKKFLKKFLLPLLLAYKLLFLLIVPLLVNGMMMMMSSSGMAGFFFALIGASITMGVFTRTQQPMSHPAPPTKTEVVTIAGSDWSEMRQEPDSDEQLSWPTVNRG